MTPALIDAAVALADTLAAENTALGGLDLARAASLFPAKQRATEAFLAAQAAAEIAAPGTSGQSGDLGRRLAALAEENRRLLERAIAVQSRVVGTVIRALPRAADGNFYRADGGFADARRPAAFTLSARA